MHFKWSECGVSSPNTFYEILQRLLDIIGIWREESFFHWECLSPKRMIALASKGLNADPRNLKRWFVPFATGFMVSPKPGPFPSSWPLIRRSLVSFFISSSSFSFKLGIMRSRGQGCWKELTLLLWIGWVFLAGGRISVWQLLFTHCLIWSTLRAGDDQGLLPPLSITSLLC